jgi:hypothetical protein
LVAEVSTVKFGRSIFGKSTHWLQLQFGEIPMGQFSVKFLPVKFIKNKLSKLVSSPKLQIGEVTMGRLAAEVFTLTFFRNKLIKLVARNKISNWQDNNGPIGRGGLHCNIFQKQIKQVGQVTTASYW